ncbi:MAG: hypothetical protein FXF49_10635 [Flexistipes sinusarabici]|uniref:Uncharacterized protein n=1 Tax=Flexistipes sinusarabici TaxID=2352 RepID=A0A5D0MMY8_FLESI|nr:hypothetical protein [Flexistipes sinusarabici]TYB32618.1 MAG: hypothetical protein FXF49_10635 [Flexistipes sinusarabici]
MKKFFDVSFELKIFLFIIVTLVVGLSMLNAIFLYSFKAEIQKRISVEIDRHQKLSQYTTPDNPAYLKVSEKNIFIPGYELYDIRGRYKYYVDKSYLEQEVRNKLLLMFYWDAVIIFSVSVLYYFTAYRLIKNRENYSKSFEIILLVLGHKLKNYLAGQRVNAEIIDRGTDSSVIAKPSTLESKCSAVAISKDDKQGDCFVSAQGRIPALLNPTLSGCDAAFNRASKDLQKLQMRNLNYKHIRNAVNRIKTGNRMLTVELENIFSFVKKFGIQNGAKNEKNTYKGFLRQNLNLSEIVDEVEKEYYETQICYTGITKGSKKIKKKINLKRVTANYDDMKFILFLLMDNAYKYSENFIYIRAGICKRKKYLFIANDFGNPVESGLGVGLSVAEQLCRKNRIKLSWNAGRYFTSKIIF